MRLIWSLAAAGLAVSSATHAADLGPLAPFTEGKVQCYRPNEVAKTCESIGAYRLGAHGEILNLAIVMIASSPPIVMSTETEVAIKAGQDCGVFHAKDFDSSTFTVDGRAADPAQTVRLRAQAKAGMQRFFGHEVCVGYLPNGAALLATSKIDGVAHPEMDQKVIWVAKSDGYRVAP